MSTAVQIWFKHDLRVDDHPGLQTALSSGKEIVPVFCFDPAQLLHLLRAPHGLQGEAVPDWLVVTTLSHVCSLLGVHSRVAY